MLSMQTASLSYAFSAPAAPSRASVRMETKEDLQALAVAQNPTVGFWDPIGLADANLFDLGEEGSIGWLRHAEIKHGRVAMAGFVGYCLQSNGIVFPWALTGGPLSTEGSTMFSDIAAAGAPPDQWDALPTAAKLQFLGFIGLLEAVGETAQPHYTKGGKPGFYPSLKSASNVPHPVPFDLYDPVGLFKMTDAQKERRLLMEVNNGRLAMIGIFSFLCAAKGLEVPPLADIIPPYSGDPMGPFSESDASLPFVADMLAGTKGMFAGIGNN
tara:strand:+ start:193 stop:1002 length:810 start_codon:yes stop_codon:yes gene_type:complete